MGLLDRVLGVFRKNAPKGNLSSEYIPIVPAKIDYEEPDEDSLKFRENLDKIHKDNISAFDYTKLKSTDNAALSCIERSFLKYICGHPIHGDNVASYWTHEYKIPYALLMSKFFNRGLLTTGYDVKYFTVNMLKTLLRLRGLPVTGKKADLIARLGGATTLSSEESAAMNANKIYVPTKKGRAIIAVTPSSITKDPDFEDDVLDLIQKNQIDAAYTKVMQWRSRYSPSYGLHVDWQNHRLSNVQRQDYEKLLIDAPDIIIGSCTILAKMLGSGQIIPLLDRLGKYTPPPPAKIIFTKDEVLQHEKEFFKQWEAILRRNNLIVEIKQKANCYHFLWQECPIGRIAFSQTGHYMQWIEDAYIVDFNEAWRKDEDTQERYFRDASGKVHNAKPLTLQECVNKIPYWVQYIHVLMKKKTCWNK